MQMAEEWSLLLQGEARYAAGEDIAPMDYMHWRLRTPARLLYLAHERDSHSASSDALELLKTYTCHVGDSRIVEKLDQQLH